MSLEWLDESRERTLALVESMSDDLLCAWPDPAFSPICWHLGHIAFTEAAWILEQCAGNDSLSKPYYSRFAQDGCAKKLRAQGYKRDELFGYLAQVRSAIHTAWPSLQHPMKEHDFLAWFIAAHEDQHRETMRIVRALGRQPTHAVDATSTLPTRVAIPGGEFCVGTNSRLAYDNERPQLDARVDNFVVDAHPTTCGAWQHFIDAGGYTTQGLWSDSGWTWLQQSNVTGPRASMQNADFPVMGISYYEAEAYARYRGGRLLTELEWEHLAQRFGDDAHLDCDVPRAVRNGSQPTDVIGNVWEWTADWFEAREGFSPYPYEGYSAPYFNATHRTMRGGSFATAPRIATSSFRNWYVPESRQLFVGVRVAYDG